MFSLCSADLSEEPLEENLSICEEYLVRMTKINCMLEMELGITGGEEDGVDNSGVDQDKLHSSPEEVNEVWQRLSKITPYFMIAAAFGNVHGAYKPGNVKLMPENLGKHQAYIKETNGLKDDKPALLVFHGGSGSLKSEIDEAVSYGVVKMNVDSGPSMSFLLPFCSGRLLGCHC